MHSELVKSVLDVPQRGRVVRMIGCKAVDGSLDALRNITFVKIEFVVSKTTWADPGDGTIGLLTLTKTLVELLMKGLRSSDLLCGR